MDNLVIPGVEMAMRSITGSSGRGPNSVVQNTDQRDFSGTMENSPPMTTSGRVDLNIDQDRYDEICNVENFDDGNFTVLRPKCERQAHLLYNG